MHKPISLSHSARQKYDTCARMYDLHYNQLIRPIENTSALEFGSAIDKACEEYLKTRNKELSINLFKEEWSKIKDGETKRINFNSNDFDHELLLQSDNEYILQDTVFTSVSDLVKAGEDQERINYARWISLYRKGLLLVDALMNWVEENVEEILGTQIAIELEDEEGNKVPGLADFVMKVKGYDKPILVDLKTSARYYDRNSVKESEQLGLYFFYLQQTKFPDMERAAYLVLNKQIKKNRTKTCLKCGIVTAGREKTCAVGDKKNRCNGDFSVDIRPEVVVQYIHDEIPEGFIQDTINKFNISVEGIKAGKFEPCFSACDNYFGRKCPFYAYCHDNQSMEGLIKKERKVDV